MQHNSTVGVSGDAASVSCSTSASTELPSQGEIGANHISPIRETAAKHQPHGAILCEDRAEADHGVHYDGTKCACVVHAT